MSQAVNVIGKRVGSFIAMSAGGLMLAGAVQAASGPAVSRPGLVPAQSDFQAAARQQPQIAGAEDGATACDMSRINDAVAMIYQWHDAPAALHLARRCELQAVTSGRPDYKTLASRIKALVAIQAKDMDALQHAGENLVADAQAPEFIADGHLFIAFACTFSGRVGCARTHLEQAKTLFTRHDVAGAMDQLMSVEQALLKLEAAPVSGSN
ncbi:MAG: hypothetical protein QM742_12455 [Aquabacterium sp.]